MHLRSCSDLEPFVTLDRSVIREWAARVSAPARNQSLAEATPLRIVCACVPVCSHEGTQLTE
jgi:hypothetical protein